VQLAVSGDGSVRSPQSNRELPDDVRLQRWAARSESGSTRRGGECQRSNSCARSPTHDHQVESSSPSTCTAAQCRELELALTDAHEHKRRDVRPHLAFDFDLDRERIWSKQQSKRGYEACQMISETSFEPIADSNEGDVCANRARVQEELMVNDAGVD
jgi:hypothetical protein